MTRITPLILVVGCILGQLSGQTSSSAENRKPDQDNRYLQICLYGGGQWFNPLDGDSETPIIALPLVSDKTSRAQVGTFNLAEIEKNPLMKMCMPFNACTLEATPYGNCAGNEILVKLDFIHPVFDGFIEYALDRPALPISSYYAFHGKRQISTGRPVLLGSLYNLANSQNGETQIFAHITGQKAPSTSEDKSTYKLTASWQGDDPKEKHAIAVVLSPGSSARLELQQILPFYKTDTPPQTPAIAIPKAPIALSATMSDIERSGYMTIQFQWDNAQLESVNWELPAS